MQALLKWLKKRGIYHEINGKIVFIKAHDAIRVLKYIARYQKHLKAEYRAHYTWLAIMKGDN